MKSFSTHKDSIKATHPPSSNGDTAGDVDALLDNIQSRLLSGSSSAASSSSAALASETRPDPEDVSILRNQFRVLCQHQLATFAQPKQRSPSRTARQSADSKAASSPKSYEDRVWQVVFRRVIDPLRAKLSRGDAVKAEETRLELLAALYDAMGYFHAVISALRGYSALNPDTGLVLRFGYLGPAETTQGISLHRCLTYLGDLERYHHQVTHASQPTNGSDDPSPVPFPSTAYSRYLTALALYPSGQACSQLGTLISTYFSSVSRAASTSAPLDHLTLLAMYWFTRGIAMRQPSSVCRDNLETLCTQFSKSADTHHPLVIQLLLHALAPTLALGAIPLPTEHLDTQTLLAAIASAAPLVPTHHLAHLLLSLLTHLLPKHPPTSDPDLIGHHVRRGLVLAIAFAAAATCPRARHVLATWTVAQRVLVADVLRTSVAAEVADRLRKVVDLSAAARMVADQLPVEEGQGEGQEEVLEFKWIDEVDRELCQFACLDDMYMLLDPFKSATGTLSDGVECDGDQVRLARLASLLDQHFPRLQSSPSSHRPPAALSSNKGPGLRLIQTASGPKLMQELVPSVLVLACDVVMGDSVKGSSAWRAVSRVLDLEVCRVVVPTYVIEYLDHAKNTSPLARHVIRSVEAIVRQQAGDGLVRIQAHSSSPTPTPRRPRAVAVTDDSDATFDELKNLQSCVDNILSRDPEDMPHIVVVTNNAALRQAYEAAAVRCVRPAALVGFVSEQMGAPRRD